MDSISAEYDEHQAAAGPAHSEPVVSVRGLVKRSENLADRIMVLCAGRIVAEGTPQTLGGREHMATAISFTLPDLVPASA